MTTDLSGARAGDRGYSPDFLGLQIAPPTIGAALQDDTVRLDGSEVIPYTHFSLALSKSRRFARWVAWNIDGGTLKKISRNGIPFIKDARIPAEFQSGDELYSGNRLDRGHLARRADLVWGPLPEAKSANIDSFFFTNITPQMDDFNQSSKEGVWGRLEDAVFADVEVQDLKVSAFGGPVFHDDDRVYRETRLPREYWKVLAYVEQGEFKSHAFLLTQNLNPFEAIDFDEFRAFQISTAELEERTQLQFAADLRTADAFTAPSISGDREPLNSVADIQW
ncbi:DNA/RNA non-specific endonuclease [Pseudarthrobacter sulfonivorans]|uniref:DNA/RNA non-specific endonuclease n=1 Tax=Pseudarthrobacter sulfonivorans TaxID=121292 RepID=UPI002864B5FB|nr:DNA/RNA non-specific endonuclease [Pseudarthrobacter sulfonivorans]MDR6417037.1 endonuclease G [Pseudarthrobacter sulfonivorans]